MPLKSCSSDYRVFQRPTVAAVSIPVVLMLLSSFASAQPDADSPQAYQQAQQNLVQDIQAIRDSLLTPQIVEDYQKSDREYRTAILVGCTPNERQRYEALKAGLAYRVFRATDPDVQAMPARMQDALNDLSRDLGRGGNQITNADGKKRFRSLMCSEVMPHLTRLLDHNLLSRSFALEILPDLEVVAPQTGQNLRREMFDEVDDVLVGVLENEEQPDVVKLRAANSLKRYLEKTDAVPQVQLAIAGALADELANSLTEWQYQDVLIHTLGRIDTPREVVGDPKTATVIRALASVVQDGGRDLLVRCHAARALGKAGFDERIDFDPLAWKTVQLAVEVAVKLGQDKRMPQWKKQRCGWYLYLAFHHETEQGRDNRRNPEGFLNRAPNSDFVRSAYEVLLPIATDLIFSGQIQDQSSLVKADEWLGQNQPQKLVYDPASPPLEP